MAEKRKDHITADTLFAGRLLCLQHRHGYRFAVDSVLLAHFVEPKPGDQILDLCAGCGVVSLILAYRRPQVAVTALEIQPQLAALLRESIAVNELGDRIEVIEGDCRKINELVGAGSFTWVVSNPPYRRAEAGRLSPEAEQAMARHEISVDLAGVVTAISFALKARGRAALVYPAKRGAALIAALKNQGLEPKRLQVVYNYPGGEARLVLIEAMKGGGEELAILPPFYIYQEQDGDYTAEMAKMYEP